MSPTNMKFNNDQRILSKNDDQLNTQRLANSKNLINLMSKHPNLKIKDEQAKSTASYIREMNN